MKKSSIKTGFILSYAAIFIQSIISIIYTPVMLRLLGSSDYGLLQLAISAISNLGILSFGFSGSYLRFYSQLSHESKDNSLAVFNGMYALIFSAAALLALVSGSVITLMADKIFSVSLSAGELSRLRVLLAVMTVNLALNFLCNIFDSFIIARERFTFQKILIIISALLNPMLTFPLLLQGGGSGAVAVCMSAITLIKLAAGGIFCVKRLNMRFAFGFDRQLFSRLCAFSFFIFLNMISDQINWNADKTLLGILLGTDDVTLYSLGAQFNTYFLTLSYALLTLYSPRAYRAAVSENSGLRLSSIFTEFGRLQISVMGYFYLMLIAVGKPFIRIWSGIDSNVPYYTAIILISPLVLISAQSLGIEIQRAKDMHRFRSVLYFAAALGNIAISIPLCIRFGAVGCAFGTCACLVTANILIMNVYYSKRVKLDMAQFFKGLFSLVPAFAAPCVLAAALNLFLPQGIIPLTAGAAALTLVYFLSMWFFGIGRDINEII